MNSVADLFLNDFFLSLLIKVVGQPPLLLYYFCYVGGGHSGPKHQFLCNEQISMKSVVLCPILYLGFLNLLLVLYLALQMKEM